MVSRKFVRRTNACLKRVELFYTYSCVNGLCFSYFQFFLSARRSLKNYVNSQLTSPHTVYYGILQVFFNADDASVNQSSIITHSGTCMLYERKFELFLYV